MSNSWSFPTSPRNPEKIRIELSILVRLVDDWKIQNKKWKPDTTEVEFGEALRASGEFEGEDDVRSNLRFQKQADTITRSNLAWTARARFGTLKFLGFTYITKEGFVELTEAGRQIITTKRPDIIMLKQLIKWQYPDNQHQGKSYPHGTFHIWPFMAVAQLIMQLGGLTKHELALFCFTMTTMKDIAKARKAISDFRLLYAGEKGKVPKRRLVSITRKTLKEEAQIQGYKLPFDSFRDYADSLGRYMRYTGLFSINGNRIVITRGREKEVEEILKLQHELYPYKDPENFYRYYGNPDVPILTTDINPTILKLQIENLASELVSLHAEFGVLKYGTAIESPIILPKTLPDDIEELRTLLDNLRDVKKKVEFEIIGIRGRGPEKLAEALEFYDNIIGHKTFDAATYLEWNTWRVFVALDRAKKVKPNLIMDENLQPVNPALGGGPDIEVSFDTYHIVPEVTMRRGTDQAYYETYPVIRHIEDFMKQVNDQETYGLFIAPRCHQDTIHQFYVSWKYGGPNGKTVKIVPLTINQFKDVAQWYVAKQDFQPEELRLLFEQIGEALYSSSSSQEWNSKLPMVIEQWKQQIQTEINRI
ncbi:MAG: AlwI family type II restriction endonuclease [Ktedonobacteraceae bacterium]